MNNNVETLIRAIVPLSFMAIWALTSLFNRESKPKPSTTMPAGRGPVAGPRPRPAGGDPTLRFASRSAAGPTSARSSPARRDDEIVIRSSSTMTPDRLRPGRPGGTPPRRPARGRPAIPERPAEPTPAPTRTRLAGVTQNVNQQLANATIDLAPLTALPPVAGLPPVAALTPLGATDIPGPAAAVGPAAAASLLDPARLREAFVLNEILQRPVSLRGRGGPRPG